MGGQIVDATIIQARRPRLSKDEKATVKAGGAPAGWSKAKRTQMDTDGRWPIKRGRRRPPGEGESQARVAAAITTLPGRGFGSRWSTSSPPRSAGLA
jgi:hypothetical protein